MEKVIGIKIPYTKQVMYLPSEEAYEIGANVLIESGGGKFITQICTGLEEKTIMHHIYKRSRIIGLATNEDKELYDKNLFARNEEYVRIFNSGIKQLDLKISLLGVWQSIDDKYVKFIYYSNTKINFKEIIDYVLKRSRRRIRIELVQVGTREYTTLLGGYGVCGNELCCHARSYAVPPITSETLKYIGYRIDIKEQLIGTCGKYKCCLLYEAQEYRNFMEKLPDYNDLIIYEGKKYRVADINIFTKLISLASGKERIEVPYEEFLAEQEINGSNT